MVLRRHPDIRGSDNSGPLRRRLVERRPATVLFVAAGALLAAVVQQSLADIFPERVGAGEANGIGLLNFDGAAAAAT